MFKKIRQIIVSAGLVTLCFSPAVYADDTDIYTTSAIVPGKPFVMLMLDLSPDLNSTSGVTCDQACKSLLNLTGGNFTNYEYLVAVLKAVLTPVTTMKVGIMTSHDTSKNCTGGSATGCSNGAYVVSGFKDMGNATEKAELFAALDNMRIPAAGQSMPYQGKEIMLEFFRYLTGQDVYNGHLGYKDYNNSDGDAALIDAPRDLSIELAGGSTPTSQEAAPGRYVSPLDPITDKCAKIFTVSFLYNSPNPGVDDDSDSAITAGKSNGGMGGIDFGHHGMMTGYSTSGNTMKNVLNWMYNINDLADGTWGNCPKVLGRQRVTSFFCVRVDSTDEDEYAAAGGTSAPIIWDPDPKVLYSKIHAMVAQILSVSTTFTAASVPVSVLNRSQIVDNVYIALFEADSHGKARWPGNVKKLKLDSTGTVLQDANDVPAIFSDGRIKFDALTYWTDAANLPPPDTNKQEVTGKDGRSVPRGGAGQKIPGFIAGDPGLDNATAGARQLYYEPSTAGAALSTTPLNGDTTTASALQTALGAVDSAEALRLIKFARGYDTMDEDGDKHYDDIRSWIMGDSLHSRPLPINYGNSNTSNDPDIRLLMGTNDGFLHMFKNTDPGTTGSELGSEVWAFMPTAVMGIVKDLEANNSGFGHPYGVDGPPTAYLYDDNNDGVISGGNDKVWLYFGLRRGGKAYYGLDISDPDAPKKLWTITKATSGFGELGLTFSQPRVEKLDWGSGTKPVILFGGGYDTNKDKRKGTSGTDAAQAALGTNDSEGNAIYVVDAQTGALIWKAVKGTTTGYNSASKSYTHPGLTDSIPSTLTTLDTNSDKLVDRIYVGDTGGNVWRVDLKGNDPSKWTLVKLASLGRHYNSSEEDDRRFFHRPDFVKFKDSSGSYDAVIIGSGDRANPLDTIRKNWFYMIKDRFVTAGTPPTTVITPPDLADVTSNCLQTNNCSTAPDLGDGWRLQLETSGEKSLSTPTTISKQIYFTTYVPADIAAITAKNSCDPSEGTGRLYAVGLEDATAVNDYAVGNGTTLDKTDRYIDLKSGGIPAEVVYVPFNKVLKPDLTVQQVNTSARWKTYWYPAEK